MNKETIFYLARHGQTEWNVAHRIQGQLDSCLTPKGKEQAMQLALSCQSLGITQILTSPLGRAVETAEICGSQLNLTAKKIKGFEERHFGLWQGKLTTEMALRNDYEEIASQMTDCKPDQGESAKELFARFDYSLKKSLRNTLKTTRNETPLIILHGELLRCFMTQFNQGGLASTGYDYKNGQLIKIVYNHHSEQFSYL